MHESQNVELSFSREIRAADLMPLLAQSGWAADREHSEVESLLSATPVKVGAWAGNRLVGFARALTDNRYRALIDDVIVDESYRGQGLGSRIIDAMSERFAHVEEVFLRCEDELVSFYERLGYYRRAICLDLRKPMS